MTPRTLPSTLLTVSLAVLIPSLLKAATIHVPGDQPTIQGGIDAASAGDTVLVATGNFQGPGNNSIDFHGKDVVVRSADGPEHTHLQLAQGIGFILANGESPAATVEGFTLHDGVWGLQIRNGSAPTIRDCVISGALSGCDARDPGPFSLLNCAIRQSGARGVYISDPAPGVTISGCELTGNAGGGVQVVRARNIDVVDCDFAGNISNQGGGGLLLELEGGVARITGCRFANNRTISGTSGGGAALGTSPSIADPVFEVRDCVFDANFAAMSGGGLYYSAFHLGTATVEDCIFSRNAAETAGALHYQLHFIGTPFTPIVDCTFVDNIASLEGGALFFVPFGTVGTLLRCVFLRNESYSAGAAYVRQGHVRFESCTLAENVVYNTAVIQVGPSEPHMGELTLYRTIVAFSRGESGTPVNCAGGFADASCTNIFGNSGGDWIDCLAGQVGVGGNISQDPLFCNLEDGDLRLDAASPCAPAHSGTGCELIGALGIGCGETADVDAELSAGAPLELYALPNPVRTQAILVLGTASDERGSSLVEIYDLAGRLVHRDWVSDRSTVWRPESSAAAGVYLARVTDGSRTATTKLVLAK